MSYICGLFERKNSSMKFPEYKSVNYTSIADEVLEFWKSEKIFEESIAVREGKPSFTFYEGPPSANGTPGIHHVMARTIKDIFCRYKTLQGFQVKRKGGWDTHGLPIELQVEKELGITKDDIGKKISVKEYNQKCREAVMRFTDLWQDMTDKMGYWVDMEDPYVTYKNDYIESVWHLLKKFYEKNLLYKGFTIQPYSPAAGTGLSSHELNQPGCYKDVKDTSIVGMFKLHADQIAKIVAADALKTAFENTYVLAWTTTPWTLPANSALAVGLGIKYVLVKTFNPYTFEPVNVVVAKDLMHKYVNPKGLDGDFEGFAASDKKTIPYTVLAEVLGAALVGLGYEQLVPAVDHTPTGEMYANGNAFKIISGDFVSTEDGTGVVHISPTFGADDFRVASQQKVPPIMVLDENGKEMPIVDRKGRFVEEVGYWMTQKINEHQVKMHRTLQADEFYVKNYLSEDEKQENYKNTDEALAIILKSEGKAFKVEKYEHSYPHCWRTDKPVLYYPLDSWFIRTTAMKDRLVELNKTINWAPESTGTGRFGNWLENLVDWNLSRSRYWGTPLPIWRTEDGSEEVCIGSVNELVKALETANASGKLSAEQVGMNEVFLRGYGESQPHPKSLITGEGLENNTNQPHPKSLSTGEGLEDAENFTDFPPSLTLELRLENNGIKDRETFVYQTDLHAWKVLKNFARENRKNQTEAETIIWNEVRNSNLGIKFRRQHSFGGYIADFASIPAKIIIEIDGEIHENQKSYDEQRTKFLNYFGFRVLRFSNEDVLNNLPEVIATIKEALPSPVERGQGRSDDSVRFNDNTTTPSPELTKSNNSKSPNDNTSTFDLHRPYVDEVFMVSSTGQVMTRETDLIDVWFDSGAMPYAQWHYPFDTQNLDKVFPADFISEGVDQTRGWFFTLHTIAGMLFDTVAFKNVVSTGLVLDKNGNKMSKSKGNGVDPFETMKTYGADATRWYMITNAEPWDNLKFNVDGIGEVQRKFFGTLTNTYNFFALYANLDNYTVEQFNRVPKEKLSELDRWIISKVYTLAKEVAAEFDAYNPTKAGRLVQDFVCDDLSNWYVRLNRRRFWQGELNDDKRAAYQTMQHCLCAVAQFIAPIAPFYADWLYKNLTEGVRAESIEKNTPFKHASVHFSDWHTYEPAWVDADLLETMDQAQRICSLVHSLRKKSSLKVRQPLMKILVPVKSADQKRQIEHVADIIKSETNIKQIEFVTDDSGLLKKKVKPNFKALGPKYGKDMKAVADVISTLSPEDLKTLESAGSIKINAFEISLADVEILTEDIPGWLVAVDRELTVALDIALTEELIQEGIARDFVNRVQNFRKDSGFEVTDKISITLERNNVELAAAVENFKTYINQEVQAVELNIVNMLENPTVIEMDAFELRLKIAVEG
jgi:isoleucyl-tRNA synthetase/very-short-patch-repair endonuclease